MEQTEIIETDDRTGAVISVYKKGRLLGTGGFAHCYEVTSSHSQFKYAAKIIPKRQIRDEKTKSKILTQIRLHKMLKHENIVQFAKVFEDQTNVYILMELCEHNTLKQLSKRRCRLTEFETKVYLKQLVDGVEYMHNNHILHRDLKLGNIFINSRMQLKLGDFGLSTKIRGPTDRKYTTCGTPNYIAPQILAETGHSYEVDAWALGVILYTLLVGKPPFECESVEQTYSKIRSVSFEFPEALVLSEQSKDLVSKLLTKDPVTRLRVSEIREHKFLSSKLNFLPDLLPTYTLYIPPEASFLSQYHVSQKLVIKVLPRRINKLSSAEKSDRKELFTSRPHSKETIYEPAKSEMRKKMLSVGMKKSLPDLNQAVVEKQKKPQKETAAGKQSHQNRFISPRNELSKKTVELHRSPLNLASILSVLSANRFKNQTSPTPKQADRQTDTRAQGLIVESYLDMTKKYGVGYILSNGGVGCIFNDKTTLFHLSRKSESADYFYYDKKTEFRYLYEQILGCEELLKKVQILKMISRKLRQRQEIQNLETARSPIRIMTKPGGPLKSNLRDKIIRDRQSQASETVYCKRFIKFRDQYNRQDIFVFKLGSGAMQFFWNEDYVMLKDYKWISWKLREKIMGRGVLNEESLKKNTELYAKILVVKDLLKTLSSDRIQTSKSPPDRGSADLLSPRH